MSADDARAGKIKLVPPAERKRCAFWRVWCLVELAAALAENKPVVMLVGSRQPSGEFEPDPRMLVNMYRLVDINDSEATLPEDVALILDAMLPQILGLADRVQAPLQSTPSASPPFSPSCCASQAVRAVNALAKGALTGALRCMRRPEILRAALGRTAPLLARSSAVRAEALPAAAAGGFLEVVRALLAAGVEDADRRDEMGQTALMNAAQGGHCEVGGGVDVVDARSLSRALTRGPSRRRSWSFSSPPARACASKRRTASTPSSSPPTAATPTRSIRSSSPAPNRAAETRGGARPQT